MVLEWLDLLQAKGSGVFLGKSSVGLDRARVSAILGKSGGGDRGKIR
ncbi:hypothetical protein PJF56_19935 [Roseofilum sp. BLCC_M91]|uniref:Transposase n=1 Tax=Roseofilum halophilum BLCC-M91 TaxID=3022259 RepID=A0ABT7BPM5_9CYAN|nr:hypothetical protein [Roseofilum halophilum]MDJ1181135.1 hypothetical protein [Roseofilum halophilum BLCC-M91]